MAPAHHFISQPTRSDVAMSKRCDKEIYALGGGSSASINTLCTVESNGMRSSRIASSDRSFARWLSSGVLQVKRLSLLRNKKNRLNAPTHPPSPSPPPPSPHIPYNGSIRARRCYGSRYFDFCVCQPVWFQWRMGTQHKYVQAILGSQPSNQAALITSISSAFVFS